MLQVFVRIKDNSFLFVVFVVSIIWFCIFDIVSGFKILSVRKAISENYCSFYF